MAEVFLIILKFLFCLVPLYYLCEPYKILHLEVLVHYAWHLFISFKESLLGRNLYKMGTREAISLPIICGVIGVLFNYHEALWEKAKDIQQVLFLLLKLETSRLTL